MNLCHHSPFDFMPPWLNVIIGIILGVILAQIVPIVNPLLKLFERLRVDCI